MRIVFTGRFPTLARRVFKGTQTKGASAHGHFTIMANKNLFTSFFRSDRPADAVNSEGAPAYALSPKAALAQVVLTGCLNGVFYSTAEEQLEALIDMALDADPVFVARLAVFARRRGGMKDSPAALCAVLAFMDLKGFAQAAPLALDSPRQVRAFAQMIRSGRFGRRSFGSAPRRFLRRWPESRSDEALFRATVGNDPSLADLVRMVHPKPSTPSRAAFYGFIVGQPHDATALPEVVKTFEAFKASPEGRPVPDAPWEMLAGLPLTASQWRELAVKASPQVLVRNLNTFERHGVYKKGDVVRKLAAKLRDATALKEAKVQPQTLLAATLHTKELPKELVKALDRALEKSLATFLQLPGKVVAAPDCSGSMSAPLTGYRQGATTKIMCAQMAALLAAAVLRASPDNQVIPFTEKAHGFSKNRRSSYKAILEELASINGGTSISSPLAELNRVQAQADLVLIISDNESWVDAQDGETALVLEWNRFKTRNPRARLVCLDLAPNTTSQAPGRSDILNVGGFSEEIHELIGRFARGELGDGQVVAEIERTELAPLPGQTSAA